MEVRAQLPVFMPRSDCLWKVSPYPHVELPRSGQTFEVGKAPKESGHQAEQKAKE